MSATINGHKAVTLDECRFFLIQPDAHGRWAVYYNRNDQRCYRQITDSEGKSIPRRVRRPIGWELIDTVKSIINRDLTRNEEEALFCDLKIIS